MAKYVQLTADMARAAIDGGVCRDLLVALEYIALSERLDAPYGEVKRALAKVAGANIELHLEDLIGSLLADRARARRKRSKIEEIAELRPVTNIREENGKAKIKEDVSKTEENDFLRFIPGALKS